MRPLTFTIAMCPWASEGRTTILYSRKACAPALIPYRMHLCMVSGQLTCLAGH